MSTIEKQISGIAKGTIALVDLSENFSEKERVISIELQEQINTGSLADGQRVCPECGKMFKLLSAQDVTIDYCPLCNSLWFDSGELAKLTGEYRDLPSLGLKLRSRKSKYSCPVCEKLMEEHIFKSGANLLVDVCIDHGLYLESGEFKRALELT